MEQHILAVPAIYRRRFVQCGVYPCNSSQIYNSGVPCCFDDVCDDQYAAKHLRSLHKIDGLSSHGHDKLIHHAACVAGNWRLQEHLHQTGKDNPRQKIRQIHTCLHYAFQPAYLNFIYHQCQKHIKAEAKDEVVDINDDRIFECLYE